MATKKIVSVCACIGILLATGCTSYYHITDQATRRAYYTTGYDRTDSGGIRFYDEISGADVTLQSSEVREISKEDFNSKVRR